MNELDELLRGSLGRLAEPGDPTGVLDAIRSRVEAAGPSGDGGSGPGGAAAGSPWAGPAVLSVIALAATAGGIGLAFAAPGAPEPVGASPAPVVHEAGIDAAACPGGPAVATLDPGARVLALARSEDGGYLQVRNPSALGTTVWVRASEATVDAGQDVNALPVASCDEGGPIVAEVTEAPAPEPAVTEAPQDDPDGGPKPPPPPPPADTTPPTIQVGSWNQGWICHAASAYGPYSASITIVVGDNVGVTGVSGSSSNAGVSVSGPSGSGANRTFTVSRTGTSGGNITVSFTVFDAAGNSVSGSSPTLLTYPECIG